MIVAEQYLVIASRGNERVVLAYCNIRDLCMVSPQGSQEATIAAAPYLDQPIISTLTQRPHKKAQRMQRDTNVCIFMHVLYVHMYVQTLFCMQYEQITLLYIPNYTSVYHHRKCTYTV